MEEKIKQKSNLLMIFTILNFFITFIAVSFFVENVGDYFYEVFISHDIYNVEGSMLYLLAFMFGFQLIIGIIYDKLKLSLKYSIVGIILMTIGTIFKFVPLISIVCIGIGYAIYYVITAVKVIKLDDKSTFNYAVFMVGGFLSTPFIIYMHERLSVTGSDKIAVFPNNVLFINSIICFIILICSYFVIFYLSKKLKEYKETIKKLVSQNVLAQASFNNKIVNSKSITLYYLSIMMFLLAIVSISSGEYEIKAFQNYPISSITSYIVLIISVFLGYYLIQIYRKHLYIFIVAANVLAVVVSILIYKISNSFLTYTLDKISYISAIFFYSLCILFPFEYLFKLLRKKGGLVIGLIGFSYFLGLAFTATSHNGEIAVFAPFVRFIAMILGLIFYNAYIKESNSIDNENKETIDISDDLS